ncbi:MAG: DUF2088 domain-containing protein [Thermomicrobiales bacterium]|nr:DUF2088 domain-containing protein [Thermomicrobiales bacterium]
MSSSSLSVFERGTFPRWTKVRQQLDATEVSDVAAAVAQEFARPEVTRAIGPGTRVCLTGGSRGIDKIDLVLKAAVAEVRKLGGEPFIIPAMGSHGGATTEGQLDILAHYGVTPELMGCEIRASMETVELGTVEGDIPVYFDKIAYEQADVVIPVGRVKPHTDFHGPIESGLMKMIAIGLGKQKGADAFHRQGFGRFHTLIPAVGLFTLSHINMPFGIALVENGYGHLSLVEAVPGREIIDREPELLKLSRERLGRLPGEKIDILFVDEIGKNISGDGADPNVINRDISGLLETSELNLKPSIHRVIFRDLTEDTQGNACGVGLGDFVLRRLADKIDPISTYMNVITSKYPAGGRTPMVVNDDRQALYLALASAQRVEAETARIARIKNTKDVEEFWASEPLLPELLETGRVEVLGELAPMAFDANGMFVG